MKKFSKRQFWIIGIAAALLLGAAIVICVAAGIFSGKQKPSETGAGLQRRKADGIRFEPSDELRGRMLRVMARRAAETSIPEDEEAIYLQKLYDGTLLCFAEAAKRVWPELDTGSLSGSLLFEDEAEQAQFMEEVARLIGETCIDKPEDITYWINKETLAWLLEQDRGDSSECN